VRPGNVADVPGIELPDRVEFDIEGVRFVSAFVPRAEEDAFTIVKDRTQLARYDALLREFHRPRMVELGIAHGGSLAYFAMRARPRRLVAVEFEPARVAGLDRFIEARDLAETVRPYYGVDQGDRPRVASILADEFGDESLDLVIDDASHEYAPSLASFETIFPLLRPGGLYLIEDWAWQHEMAAVIEHRLAHGSVADRAALAAMVDDAIGDGRPMQVPLSKLVTELTLAQATGSQLIEEVCVNRHWIAVRRGPARVESSTFRLADHYADPFDMVSPSVG
jgi:predicted O-methyltransferase YrrM